MDPGSRPTMVPREVLDEWGVTAATPLEGGRGTAFCADDVVFKPVTDDVQAIWIAELLATLPEPSDIRLIRPARSRSGRWVVNGWSAWHRLDGTLQIGDWRAALEVSRHFHAHVADVQQPDVPPASHPWAIGDRYAWGERAFEMPAEFSDVATRLESSREALSLPNQLVHGDLLNNILVADHLRPAVIDVSPYWRPARYADAIIVVDAFGWNGAGADALDTMRDPQGVQLMIRATLFRLASAVLLCDRNQRRLAPQRETYEHITAALLR
jgi:uncharacterized protein (TIGR02569 family)